jgi:PST family polysaccharide transporter
MPRLGWWRSLRGDGDKSPGAAEFKYFAGFFGLNVTLTALNIATLVSLRAAIVHDQGLAGAGLFAAAWGLGGQSLGLVLSSFGIYVLPTLAAAAVGDRVRHLQDAATLVIGASLPLVVGLLAFKPLVVSLLFSAEFLPAIALLQILLIGNYLKALSWVMAAPMLATADLRPYFVIEAGWFVIFAAIALIGIYQGLGLPIVGVAFVVAYVFHLGASAILARRRFNFTLNRRSSLLFLGGALLIAATAAATWNAQSTNWILAPPATAAACVMALFGLTPSQRGKLFALLPWRRGA